MWEKFRARGGRPAVLLAYGLVVAVFVAAFAQYHIPGKGFSYLISFGGQQPNPPVETLKGLDYYVEADSGGYDAQYYVQIAMHPDLREPQLAAAVDNLPYRARRILISWMSYAMGLGEPAGVLRAFVLQNAISWLLLAGVLLWWFPPTSWTNLLRWGGVLFSFGMCVSVRNSLVDGPSLLLIACGVMLVEKGRPWWGTAVLAVGGLGKETNLLGAASLLTPENVWQPRRWPVLILRGLLVALPLALWLVYIERVVGPAANLGLRNFDWPLASYVRKWQVVGDGLMDPHSWTMGILNCGPLWSALMMLALTTQFLFLVFRPAPKQAWWRVGLSFAVLMLVLGDAVWEGFPGAASRVLLPMQLAFNVLVPTGRAWLPILLLGNLTLLNAPVALQPPSGDGYEIAGDERLKSLPEGGRLRIQFGSEWHGPERYRERYWRWCRSSSQVTIVNPHVFPLEMDFNFILSALKERGLVIKDDRGVPLWQGQIADSVTRVSLSRVLIRPGANTFYFISDDSAASSEMDPRALAFCLKDWVISLHLAPENGVILTGSPSALGTPDDPAVSVNFTEGWYEAERVDAAYWRWSDGPAKLTLVNHRDTPVTVSFRYVLNAISKRVAVLNREGGKELWTGEVSSKRSEEVSFAAIELAPGENRLQLTSSLPPGGAEGDTRLLDLCLRNLVINVER